MLRLIKTLLDPFIRFYLKLWRNIKVTGKCDIGYDFIKRAIRGSKKYPIVINNSQVNCLEVGEGCRFFDAVCIGNVKLGNHVTLAGPGVKVCGNVDGISIGSYTSIGANTVIQEGEHDYRRIMTYFVNRNIIKNNIQEEITKGQIQIEEGVWIGSNSVILSGVRIGRGAVIGAGSVVLKDVGAYAIYAGNPAKKIKQRFDEDKIERVEKTAWWKMTSSDILENTHLFKDDDFWEYI